MKNILFVAGMLCCNATFAQHNTWTPKTDFGGDGRAFAVAFVIGDKIYAGTGADAGYDAFADFWEFDPVANTWTQKADFEGGDRFGAVGFSIDGKGYVALGSGDLGATLHKDVWEYDPVNDEWTQMADFEGAERIGATVFVIGDKAYVGFGQATNPENSSEAIALNDFWEFDPAAGDNWVQKGNFPGISRYFATGLSIGSAGYVAGGSDNESLTLEDFWMYEPGTDEWSRKADMAGGGMLASPGFAINNIGYVCNSGSSLWAYNPLSNSWHQCAAPETGSALGIMGFSLNGKGYIATGLGQLALKTVYEYVPKETQTITFGPLSSRTFGDTDFDLSATSSSGLTVIFESSDEAIATIENETVTIVGAGVATVTATQEGDNTYFPAVAVTRELTVLKADQSVTFDPLTGKTFNDPDFDLEAIASSSLGVSYESSDTDVATISGSTVTILGAGTTTITARQPGNTNYNAAPDVDQELTVAKADQAITFALLPEKTFGDAPFELVATASSGLGVSFETASATNAAISGTTVTLGNAGTVVITATQSGNNNYNAAIPVERDLVIQKANQEISFGNLSPKKIDDDPFELSGASSALLPLTYTSGDPSVATIDGNTVTMTGIGQTILYADQAGNTNYHAAERVARSLSVTGSEISQPGQGEFWGIATGGPLRLGGIFKTNSTAATFSIEHSFTPDEGGFGAGYHRMVEIDGKLYGTLLEGGVHNGGVLFEFNIASETYTVKHSFNKSEGNGPLGLVPASNGKLYGVTEDGGSHNAGTIFEYDVATGEIVSKHSFSITDGYDPRAGMVSGPNDKLYGTTALGPESPGLGQIFEYDPVANTLISKFVFTSETGQVPQSELIHVNGKLYGKTTFGGAHGNGTLFEYDPVANVFIKRHDFPSGCCNGDYSPLTLAENGKLYGTTPLGNSSGGALFELDPETGAYSEKVTFDYFDDATGSFNQATLALAPDGKLYGTASVYNTASSSDATGFLFEFDPSSGQYDKLYDFGAAGRPAGGLMRASNGKLYGVTEGGGAYNVHAIYEFDPSGNVYTEKHDFSFAINGGNAHGALTLGNNGKLYGYAQGGLHSGGILFEYDPEGKTYEKKVDFDRATGGGNEQLTPAPNGKLYGVTFSSYDGTSLLFEYDPATNDIATLMEINTSSVSTSSPAGYLTYLNGKLYGMTNFGGAHNAGVIYAYDLNASLFSTLYAFSTAQGSRPYGALQLAPNGKLYGVTANGGEHDLGVLFEFDPTSNVYTKKVDFDASMGSFATDLTLGPDGKFYGATYNGGTGSVGVIFEYDPAADHYEKKFDFNEPEGYSPYMRLALSSNGKLYGTAQGGEPGHNGVIFEYDPVTGIYVRTQQFHSMTDLYYPQRSLTFVNSLMQDQVITFSSPGTVKFSPNTFEVEGTINSDLPILYTSSDLNVATIDGSTVTLTGIGTTTITASQPGNDLYHPAKEISGTLTVVKGDNVISFEPVPDKTFGDAPFTLTATSSAMREITFSSTSGNITLEGGQVTMRSAGSVTIMASSTGDSWYNSAEEVSQTFCVNPPKPSVSLSGDNAVLSSSNNAGNQWYLDNEPITGAVNQTLAVTQAGIYKVITTVEGCMGQFSDDFAMIITSLGETSTRKSLIVYPNPVIDKLTVVIPDNRGSQIKIFHADGTCVRTMDTAESISEIDVSSLVDGIYILRMSSGNRIYNGRFVKK